ncbi:hypothetical protein, partial [Mycobacteroides immunogenum]|uniref:hypothetical protein n=1 Tax=Mycobacteroides immunogenum TaxID=83262 RepID=UPI001A99F9A5
AVVLLGGDSTSAGGAGFRGGVGTFRDAEKGWSGGFRCMPVGTGRVLAVGVRGGGAELGF